MSVSRSKSASHLAGLDPSQRALPSEARPKLPRHRSALAVSSTSHFVSAYTPRVEREDPFSLFGFFPSTISTALAEPGVQQEWDWLHSTDEEDQDFSGLVSPISEGSDDWDIPTPCSPEAEDALAGDAIRQEDKLGVLALSGMSLRLLLTAAGPHPISLLGVRPLLSDALVVLHTGPIDTLFLPSRGGEPYVDDRLFSPYTQPGDPLDADAVYDALRALRTADSLPSRSAVEDGPPTLHDLFSSSEKDAEDKVVVLETAAGLGALVSWGVSRVVDYVSPV